MTRLNKMTELIITLEQTSRGVKEACLRDEPVSVLHRAPHEMSAAEDCETLGEEAPSYTGAWLASVRGPNQSRS